MSNNKKHKCFIDGLIKIKCIPDNRKSTILKYRVIFPLVKMLNKEIQLRVLWL